MNEQLGRMRARQGDMIRGFLDSKEGAKWNLQHYETEGGTVLAVAKEGVVFPVQPEEMLRRISLYQKQHVLFPQGSNIRRADCVHVAIEFCQAFEKDPQFRDLRDRGYLADRITTGTVMGRPLTFLREAGHAFHEMNLVELPKEEGGPWFSALDLTARYNMDIEEGQNDIFVVSASSQEELFDVLKNITNATWRLVHE